MSERNAQTKIVKKRHLLWIVMVLLVGVLLFSLSRIQPRSPETVTPVVESPPSRRLVTLYFASADGVALVAENREIDDCIEERDCMVATLQALLSGPAGELAPVLPAQAVLQDVQVDEAQVVVDFSQELLTAHPGGTQSELLSVYAVINTLSVNYPHLRKVLFQVNGEPVDTLKGHVDLRHPLAPDYSLVKEGSAPTGNLATLPQGE